MRLNALLRWQLTFENVIKERSWRHRLLTILHSCACATPCTCVAVVHVRGRKSAYILNVYYMVYTYAHTMNVTTTPTAGQLKRACWILRNQL